MKSELAGIFITSLLGSWHCAGMCGPFSALLGENHLIKNKIFYHLGRLTTYSALVLIFHQLSAPARNHLGQPFFIVFLFIWFLAVIFEWRPKSQWLTKFLAKTNLLFSKQAIVPKGYFLGITTTLLPCPWLYGFVVLASSQDTMLQAQMIIATFWIGTIPALLGANILIHKLGKHLRSYSRKVSALLVLILGLTFWYTHKNALNSGGSDADGQSCALHSESIEK